MVHNYYEEGKTIDELPAFDRFAIWCTKIFLAPLAFSTFIAVALVLLTISFFLLGPKISIILAVGFIIFLVYISKYAKKRGLWEYIIFDSLRNKKTETECDPAGMYINYHIDTTTVKTDTFQK